MSYCNRQLDTILYKTDDAKDAKGKKYHCSFELLADVVTIIKTLKGLEEKWQDFQNIEEVIFWETQQNRTIIRNNIKKRTILTEIHFHYRILVIVSVDKKNLFRFDMTAEIDKDFQGIVTLKINPNDVNICEVFNLLIYQVSKLNAELQKIQSYFILKLKN